MSTLGIDLGTRKIAAAVFSGNLLMGVETHEAPEGVRRGWALLELGHFIHDQALFFEADQVWVEDVIVGNNRKYSIQLAEVLGVTMAFLSSGPLNLDLRTVGNKAWKREMVGNGNATKEMVRNYIVATHPDYAPLCGDDQDCFDATCIGLYGLRIAARSRDLHLTDAPE